MRWRTTSASTAWSKAAASSSRARTSRSRANEWHQLGLRAEGDRFTVTFDGKPLFTASDKTFAGAGKVALWTKADSVTRFDRVEIKPLP